MTAAPTVHRCTVRAYQDCRGCGRRVTWCCFLPEPDRLAILAGRLDPARGFLCGDCRREDGGR